MISEQSQMGNALPVCVFFVYNFGEVCKLHPRREITK